MTWTWIILALNRSRRRESARDAAQATTKPTYTSLTPALSFPSAPRRRGATSGVARTTAKAIWVHDNLCISLFTPLFLYSSHPDTALIPVYLTAQCNQAWHYKRKSQDTEQTSRDHPVRAGTRSELGMYASISHSLFCFEIVNISVNYKDPHSLTHRGPIALVNRDTRLPSNNA